MDANVVNKGGGRNQIVGGALLLPSFNHVPRALKLENGGDPDRLFP